MSTGAPSWKPLYKKARALLQEQIDRHDVGCGCQDGKAAGSEGLCPGLAKAKRFLAKTARKAGAR